MVALRDQVLQIQWGHHTIKIPYEKNTSYMQKEKTSNNNSVMDLFPKKKKKIFLKYQH